MCVAGRDSPRQTCTGPQHACAIARNLGIHTVFVHRFSSLLSAYGLVRRRARVSSRRRRSLCRACAQALAKLVHEAQVLVVLLPPRCCAHRHMRRHRNRARWSTASLPWCSHSCAPVWTRSSSKLWQGSWRRFVSARGCGAAAVVRTPCARAGCRAELGARAALPQPALPRDGHRHDGFSRPG